MNNMANLYLSYNYIDSAFLYNDSAIILTKIHYKKLQEIDYMIAPSTKEAKENERYARKVGINL